MVDEETLRGWINEYRVCWECSPLVEIHGGKRVSVGFDLDLFGRHPTQGTFGPEVFSEAQSIHHKMEEIALFALPKDVRPSRYEIDPHRAALYFRPGSGSKPEVQLTVRVLHREGYFDPIDDCETRCADEIQDRLRALGARPHAWIATALPDAIGKARLG